MLRLLVSPEVAKGSLHPKARGLAPKGGFIDRHLLVISRFFVLFYRGSLIGKMAQRLVPPLLGALCSHLLPLLALLLSKARQGQPALRPLLAFLLRLLLHRTPQRVILNFLLALPSQDTYQFYHGSPQYTIL